MPPLHEPASFLASLIQKCSTITSLEKARKLHALILTTTTNVTNANSPYLNNNLLSMYTRCGSLSDAQLVFDRMLQRTLVSYNALISAYSRDFENWVLSFRLFCFMGSQGIRPNGLTFTSLLRACGECEDWFMGLMVHAKVVKFGFLSNVCVETSLLGMYSGCGDLESAWKVFDFVAEKDDVSWNSMIFGYLKNGEVEEGIRLYRKMLCSCVVPTRFTYSMLLSACSRLGDYSVGEIIHGQLVMLNVVADLPMQNALLDMYCSCGDMRTAFSVFSRIEGPDLVSWNSIIFGYAENKEEEKAMDLFAQLLRKSLPKPDEYTFAAVVSATDAFPATDYGKPLHAQVMKTGLERSVFIGTELLSMYFKNDDRESAQDVFNLIEEKDVILWTEMIVGYCRLGDPESAIILFCKMSQEGNKCDSFALCGALSACADLATLNLGEIFHTHAIKTGCDTEIPVCGSLIDMYAKNGNIRAAGSIFVRVLNPDLKCWNSMLGGYSHHGMVKEAMELFEQVLEHGLRPDKVTFLSILSACSHGGLVERGRTLWNAMKKSSINPGPKHYSCMVSLLSRAGLFDEAEELINESIYSEGHLELWRTLLSSCVDKRNLRIGICAAEQALRLDPEDSATHTLLSNLYAAVGKWDEVAEMKKKIRGMMLEKDPGLSWIEHKNDHHVFTSGDQSSLMIDEAQAMVLRLQRNMIKPVPEEFEARLYSS